MSALADAGTPPRGGGRREGRWADLRLRVASAAVLAPAALLCIWSGGWPWTALVVVAAAALGYEWSDVSRAGRLGAAVPVAAVAAALLAGMGRPGLALLLLGGCAAVALGTVGRWAAWGVLYIGVPVVALCWLRTGAAGRADVLFLVLAVWASDIGAYAVGRIVGGTKLAPSVSPGKTRSGAVGGLAVAAVVGLLAAAAAGVPALLWAAVAAAALSVAAQAGDLYESWVKRRFGVKDSGGLIPGHGGALDRLDGLLAAAPVALLLALIAHPQGASWQ